jgi:hypothetical protein
MQPATLNAPRAATLADLGKGDAVFVLMQIGKRTNASLGTVVERTDAALIVQPEPTNPVPGQSGGPTRFDLQGRYLGQIRGLAVATTLPEGARRIGSLGVAS